MAFVLIQVVMMVTSGWLEVQMLQKVVWSSVTVVCGALSVVTGGDHQMLEELAASWDSLLKVVCLAAKGCDSIEDMLIDLFILCRSCCYFECL